MRHAMEVERLKLRGGDDVANRDGLRVARQRVSTVCASGALHDAGAAHPNQDLFDIVDGQPLARSDVATRHWTFTNALGQMQRADDAVLGEGSYPHNWRIERIQRANKMVLGVRCEVLGVRC